MGNELTNNLKEQQITVLFFHADEYSSLQIKAIEKRIKEKVETIHFLKINVSSNPEVGKSFGIRYTPQVLILLDGKEVWREEASFSEEEICSHLLLVKNGKPNENTIQ